jgi:hypothetical protein
VLQTSVLTAHSVLQTMKDKPTGLERRKHQITDVLHTAAVKELEYLEHAAQGMGLSVCLSIYRAVYLSVCLFVCLVVFVAVLFAVCLLSCSRPHIIDIFRHTIRSSFQCPFVDTFTLTLCLQTAAVYLRVSHSFECRARKTKLARSAPTLRLVMRRHGW